MSLTTAALEQLNLTGLKLERFQEVVTRLFAHGIVVRDEGGVEALYYDDARRMDVDQRQASLVERVDRADRSFDDDARASQGTRTTSSLSRCRIRPRSTL